MQSKYGVQQQRGTVWQAAACAAGKAQTLRGGNSRRATVYVASRALGRQASGTAARVKEGMNEEEAFVEPAYRFAIATG